MSEAPERMWIDPDILPSEWHKRYYCDVEYVRADRIEELEAKLVKAVEAARELMDAFYINGNVTERHYRACQAGVKLETTLAELTGGKDG